MWLKIEVEVRKASAKNAYCVYGHPSPFAFIGFAHALSLRTGIKQLGGVLAVFHKCEPHATVALYQELCFDLLRSSQRDSRPTRGTKGKSQVDVPMVDLHVSLCFEFTADTIDGLGQKIEVALMDMRFAGGVIVSSRISLSDTADEAFRFKAGFVMVESSIDPGGADVATRFSEKVCLEEGKPGWFSPSLLGFRMIETPAPDRVGARGGHPHAYADPLIGVVEFYAARKATIGDMWNIEREGSLIRFRTPSLAERTEKFRINTAQELHHA